jgi:serine/threonine-protein kinase
MEWLEGQTLSTRMLEPVTLGDAVAILVPITHALEAAHQASVIHRDLKPDNVFLAEVRGEPARIKLLDFGIAKLTSGGAIDQTRTGIMLGTPIYAAPEQVRGEPVSAPTDVYSLGVLAFELLTGTLPFVGPSAFDIMVLHASSAPPSALEHHPQLPPEIADLLAAMLAKLPAERPSLAEVRAVLSRYADDASLPPGWAPCAVLRERARARRAPASTEAEASIEIVAVAAPSTGVLVEPPRTRLAAPPPRRGRAPLAAALGVAVAAMGVALALRLPGGELEAHPIVSAVAPAAAPVVTPLAVAAPEPPAAPPPRDEPPPAPPPRRAAKPKPTPRARPVATAPPAEPAPAPTTGTLVLRSKPSCAILVDGAALGASTPHSLSLPAGRHKVTLVYPELDVTETFSVEVTAGGVERVHRDLRDKIERRRRDATINPFGGG